MYPFGISTICLIDAKCDQDLAEISQFQLMMMI